LDIPLVGSRTRNIGDYDYYFFGDITKKSTFLDTDYLREANSIAIRKESKKSKLILDHDRNIKDGNYSVIVVNNTKEGCNTNGYDEFHLMQFTPQEMQNMVENYIKAPRAPIKPSPYPTKGERFDILAYFPNVPDERIQGCGDCWVWACTGAMEIDRAVKTGIKDRLSVQWFNSNYDGACCGGLETWFANFFGRPVFGKHYAIPWSNTNAYYHEHTSGTCKSSVPSEVISKEPYYPVVYCQAQVVPTIGIEKEKAIANIKNVLNQKKPVVFSFYLSSWKEFFDFWDNRNEDAIWNFECNRGLSGTFGSNITEDVPFITPFGHAVLCVGYDDRDPKNRYWIMVNSWHAPYRPNNIFLVSMDMYYDCSRPNIPESRNMTIFTYAFQWWTFEIKTNGDGIGFFQKGGKFKLYSDIDGVIDKEIVYGSTSNKPLVGDWNNDGLDGIGYFSPKDQKFHFDNNLDGIDDMPSIRYGTSADLPLSGIWKRPFQMHEASPKEGIGYFRPSDHTFHLDYNLDGKDDRAIDYGKSDSVPLSGDWDGDSGGAPRSRAGGACEAPPPG
jgi:hypothetical protein